jgi:hypothetical protein
MGGFFVATREGAGGRLVELQTFSSGVAGG